MYEVGEASNATTRGSRKGVNLKNLANLDPWEAPLAQCEQAQELAQLLITLYGALCHFLSLLTLSE